MSDGSLSRLKSPVSHI